MNFPSTWQYRVHIDQKISLRVPDVGVVPRTCRPAPGMLQAVLKTFWHLCVFWRPGKGLGAMQMLGQLQSCWTGGILVLALLMDRPFPTADQAQPRAVILYIKAFHLASRSNNNGGVAVYLFQYGVSKALYKRDRLCFLWWEKQAAERGSDFSRWPAGWGSDLTSAGHIMRVPKLSKAHLGTAYRQKKTLLNVILLLILLSAWKSKCLLCFCVNPCSFQPSPGPHGCGPKGAVLWELPHRAPLPGNRCYHDWKCQLREDWR